MADLTRERRANIRRFAEHRKARAAEDGEQFPSAPVDPDDLRALLDAADERDRLRAGVAQALNCLQYAYDRVGNNASADPVHEYEDAIVAVIAHLGRKDSAASSDHVAA